jgi:hypothetical protein
MIGAMAAAPAQLANEVETGQAGHAHVRDDAIERSGVLERGEECFSSGKTRGLDFAARK